MILMVCEKVPSVFLTANKYSPYFNSKPIVWPLGVNTAEHRRLN
jgi:hypothetical protein